MEERLRQSESRLRTIIDTIPTIAWCSLPDGSGEYWNRQWHDYTGLSPEAARGWGWQTVIHPKDVGVLTDRWRTDLAAGRPGEVEGRLRRFHGEYRWFLFRYEPLRDETGDIVNWYGTNTDIEDRKRAEALLAGEKRLLEMVAGGHSMPEILEALCQLVESTTSGCYCSVVLVDPSGTRLEHGAAPSLPASFITSIIGRPVNVDSGPCAMAAYLNEQVIAADLSVGDTMDGIRLVPNGLGAWAAGVLVNTDLVHDRQGPGRVRDLLRRAQNTHVLSNRLLSTSSRTSRASPSNVRRVTPR